MADAPALLVMFICNHCPFVIHVADQLAKLGRDYGERGVAVVAISANDVSTHPDDSPERMAAEAERRGYTFPYLYDETQDVAKAYTAACTPRLLPVRQGSEAGVPWPTRREPARQRHPRHR